VCGGEDGTTDKRWDAGVKDCGGNPGGNARVWRSLNIDNHVDVEPSERGQHDTNNEEDCRDEKRGEILKIIRSQKSWYVGFE
jgi:hypothetical protein